MESKVMVDIDIHHRQEYIKVNLNGRQDVRDKLLRQFLQTAIPDGLVDGYCRISIVGNTQGDLINAEIVPVHPIDMQKHISIIQENASKFNTVSAD